MHRQAKSFILLFVVLALIAGILIACTPVEQPDTDPYPIVDNDDNQKYLDTTTKDEAIDRAVGSMENLLEHLDTDEVSDSGYYIGADMEINTTDPNKGDSAFILRLRANLYTYPYEIKDADGKVLTDENGVPLADPVALAHHNDIIRYSDIILEWFDGTTNEMLIGFYFDGINKNSPDPGNDLYLNLQGSKRIFRDFGDSVLYQQLIRVITQFNLETLIGSASDDGSAGTSFQTLREALQLAVTDNYKQTLNGEEATVFFSQLNLTSLSGTITEYMQSVFQPFDDKLDPLTNKYLGFLFSTLGVAEISSITSDMEFVMENNENLGKEIMNQLVMDVAGDSSVPRVNEQTGLTIQETVPYTAHISAEYDVRTSTNIVFDKAGYTEYVYGSYEYTGDMYIPMLDLKLDVLLRTDFNEIDNTTNKIFMNCRDLATDDLLIGLYYKNETVTGKDGSTANDEFTFIDIEGLEDLYGGVKFEDIGLPKAYRGGFDLADTLAWLFDFIDEYIVIAVDNILYGQTSDEASSQYSKLTSLIMDNIESTMKDEDDPSSRATIKIKIDVELIRQLLSATSETGTEYTTEQMILLINRQFNIDIESLASIFGVSVQELLDETYFEITYDVDTYAIRIDVYTTAEMSQEEIEELGAQLLLRLDLEPQHVGEKVKIVFPNFSKFNELDDVMTYSGEVEGEFTFASTEDVFLGDLFGAFMGDVRKISGSDEVLSDRNRAVPYNTPYTLPKSARIKFELVYDQYIREQVLENGRWTRTSRSAFILTFNVIEEGSDKSTNILNIYANDVSFNTANPVEELGYVWLDFPQLDNGIEVPKFKVREDVFITSFYRYMGYDFETEDGDLVLGLTDIIKALMEDSWAVFEPDVIRITTSNQTIRNFFNVDEMIATAAAKIGFKQRVRGIDSLENDYAMYTIGELEDIEGDSIYSTELHDTVDVYFDFGTRKEVRKFYFLYNDASVEPQNGDIHYRPAMRELFMGVNRDYLVTIITDSGRYAIDNFESSRQNWEPLAKVPTTVSAYYGGTGLLAEYDAIYNLHAVYDAGTGYYTVLNSYGYEIIYDFQNNVYIVGLGTASKYDEDKLDEILNPSVPWYKREINSTVGNTEEGATFANLKCLYDLGMRVKGWYVVENKQYNILYSPDKNVFIVDSQETLDALNAENYFGSGDVVYTRMVKTTSGQTFVYDLETGYYCAEVATEEVGVRYRVLYSRAENYYYVANRELYEKVPALIGESRFSIDATIDWNADFDFAGNNYTNVDWNNAMWSGFAWTDMSWEDITLEGGMFVVKVVVGEGKMATYWENIVVKIINRTVVTDKYVNIETPDKGTVLAPVADTVQVDPYVYLIYKAYYENTYSATLTATEKAKGFVNWFFSKYTVTFEFTKIYNNDEDTEPETGTFDWAFDDDSYGRAIYKESQINNRHAKNADGSIPSQYTYVYTVFEGQVIALGVEVLPRMLEAVYIKGETEANTYTVDALEASTYTIPTNLTYIFRYAKASDEIGKEYEGCVALNFKDYTAGYGEGDGAIPSMFSVLPDNFNSELPGYEIAGSDSRAIISWANPVADNVKLVNTGEDGKVHPFKSKSDNTTSSFFGIKRYVAFADKWYHEDWFRDEEIVITVNAPDKVIGERDYTYKTGEAHVDETVKVQNIQIKSYYTEGQTGVTVIGENSDWGVFYVDPFDSSTWILPDEIYAHFNGEIDAEGNQTYTPYLYKVAWRNAKGDTAVRFDNTTDKYVIQNVSEIPDGFFLYADIGEGDNTMAVKILVRKLSAYMEEIEFLKGDGDLVSETYGSGADVIGSVTETDGVKDTYQLNTYTYYVDTYARFVVPEYVRITFKDGTQRTYAVDWDSHDAWKQNTTVEINATLGDANAVRHDVYLNVKIQGKVLETLTITNAEKLGDLITSAQITVWVAGPDENPRIEVKGIPLTDEGRIDLGELGKKTPYEFFGWLFEEIKLTFSGDFADITVTDAVDSARLPIFGTLDTQKLIKEYTSAYGQGIDIYIGQDKGAHDFTVEMELIGNEHVEFDGEQSNIVTETINIEAFNADNTEKYPNGFVLSENINFYVKRADGESVYYSSVNGEPVPKVWSVACPTADISAEFWATENIADRMAGITEFEKLEVISRERLLLGGEIWLTAMLEDSSRVYVHIICQSVEIGSLYQSADDDTSKYKIVDGTITIDNIYDNYRLDSFLTPASLPSRIKIGSASSDIVKTNIVWTITEETKNELKKIDYEGTNGAIELATSTIVGKPVTLYLNVLPCEVVGLKYDSVKDREFESMTKDADGVITINVDAYQNWAYAGRFALPSALKLVYGETNREDATSDAFLYSPLTYYRTGSDFVIGETQTEIKEIPYDLSGHKLSDAENNRDVYLKCILIDGQELKIKVHILDKTIVSVYSDDSVYQIDPYGDDDQLTVPNQIEIFFKEGDKLIYTADWTVDKDFEVKYDTYKRLLENKKDAEGKDYPYFTFTATLTGYSGMADQQFDLKVYVHNRLQESYNYDSLEKIYTLADGLEDTYAHYETPKAYYHYTDPFAGRATNLPSTFWSQGREFPIIWNFTDEDISINGTYRTVTSSSGVTTYELDYITVYGHVFDAERGQPIAIRVYVDSWTYQQIRKPDGVGGYIVMEGDALRFIISAITGVSAEDNYQIDFNVISATFDADGNPTVDLTRASKLFIPEGVDPSKTKDEEGNAYDQSYPYRLYWDADAVNRAKAGNETTGYYSLGTETGEIKARYSSAKYQYERPNILSIDMGYGFGTEQNVVYVVNPLSPNFTDVEVKATGTYSGQYNVSLTDVGLTVVAKWGVDGKTPDVSGYFAGGVIRNQTVTLEMTKADDASFRYTQSFNVMLVMLDMSPTSYINNRSSDVLKNARFKTVYNASTYAGSVNPYKDVYSEYLLKEVTRDGITANVLETAIRELGLQDVSYTYRVTEWEDRIYNSNNTKTQYSKKVTVNGREYTTNSVIRRWNSVFEITGLKLGYGGDYVGIDSATYDRKEADGTLSSTDRKIIKVVNPLEPYFGDPYSTDRYVTKLLPSAVVGTKDGTDDITSFGYTFSITWWDVATGGNTVIFGDNIVAGGILDYWKIKVSVYDGANVVYEQIMNIELVLLDLTPSTYSFYSETVVPITGTGITMYTADTYANKHKNPYGDEYTELMISALNTGVSEAGISSKSYTYRIVEWGEAQKDLVYIDGKAYAVKRSKYVEIETSDGIKTTVATDMFETTLLQA